MVVVVGGYFAYKYYFKKNKQILKPAVKTMTKEDILNSLTAPVDKTNFTNQEIDTLKDLSTKSNLKTTNIMTDQEKQKILQSLTAPTK